MTIQIKDSFNTILATGWVRSKNEANRVTGEWIKKTGRSCTWKRVWAPFER